MLILVCGYVSVNVAEKGPCTGLIVLTASTGCESRRGEGLAKCNDATSLYCGRQGCTIFTIIIKIVIGRG